MGSATAYALARNGHQVVLYEQFEVGHSRGSSHGRSRIVRLAYPEVEFVELAREAFEGWRELEREAGVELLELNGLLELVDDPAIGSGAALEEVGAPYELLTPEEARRRWPVGVPDGSSVLFQPEAGIVRADLAQRAFVDRAVARGVELREKTRIDALGDIEADVVVVTAGPWIKRFFADLPVRTTRETVAYFRRDGAPLPSVVELNSETGGHLMYSLHDPVYGVKAGAHHAGAPVDPDDEGEADPELVQRIADWVAATYPDADARPVGAESCMYTTTSDERFILERRDRVVIGSPCSGHGFKFAPAIGDRLARMAADSM